MNAIYLSIFNILVSSIDKKRIVIIFTIPYSFFIALFINLRDYNYGDTISYVNYYIRDYKVLDFEPFYEVIKNVFK